ncbi:MAG TPA: class I SAM-dependent methyltransferase [Verrucomicrobiae bacterium]|nr:class I SAM-dependent methyltransferase [Verrucomicrobiae bacterium]
MKLALRDALRSCKDVLDVGCGHSSSLRLFGVPRCVGIDGYLPSVEEARRKGTHDEVFHGSVTELGKAFEPKSFDACIAIDVIEHLTKADGLQLINDMERLARKRVIFFTPNGFLPQRHISNDDLQEHLSGWEPEEMARRGFEVRGLLGPKTLRGEHHSLRKKPAVFWGLVSFAGQPLVWRKPRRAAAILCVKKLAP